MKSFNVEKIKQNLDLLKIPYDKSIGDINQTFKMFLSEIESVSHTLV